MAEVPDLVTEKKPKKPWRSVFRKGQDVYFTAFLKEDKKVFYVCKGEVQGVPGPNERQVYQVKIMAVSDRAVGGQPIVRQACLLGLIVTKRTRELTKQLSMFMSPKAWIDKDPQNVSRKQAHRQTSRVSGRTDGKGRE